MNDDQPMNQTSKMASRYKSTTPRYIRLLVPLILISIAWGQEIIDQVFFNGDWNFLMGKGHPWWGIIASSFSHGDFDHLISNTMVFIPLSWLVLTKGIRDYISVWACVLFTEVIFQIFWSNPSHGLSDICFGLLGYLVIIGVLEKRFLAIGLSVFTLILYGKFLPTLMPWNVSPGISWIGHFSGFLGGVLGAFGIYREPDALKSRDPKN